MAADVFRELIERLRQADGAGAGGLSDAVLLERFTTARDEAAFEVLVWRHGALVLGVACRWLGHTADAEDAFQATFLTLARKAASLRHRPALAAWLHRVTYRIAMRARQRRARRELVERPLANLDIAGHDRPIDELEHLLDAEVSRLPEKYRRAVVLCYLQGASTSDAAQALGCPRGTVLSRLAAARSLLQRRLVRQGVAPALLAGLTVRSAEPALPANLVAGAVRVGLELPTLVPRQIVLMSNGVIHAMFWKKCATVAAVLMVLAACGAGMTWAERSDQRDHPPDNPAPQKRQPAPKGTEKAQAPAPQKTVPTRPFQPDVRPEPPPAEESKEILQAIMQQAQKALDEIEAQRSKTRLDARTIMIEIEEKMRELEFLQTWQREQQKRGLQNLETSLRDRANQLPDVQAKLRNLEAEVVRAEPEAKAAEIGVAIARAKTTLELARRNLESQAMLEKKIRDEIAALEKDIEKRTQEGLKGEEARTRERIELRREMAATEERVAEIERKQARQRDQVMVEYERAALRLHGRAGESAGRMHDLERKVEALQRELSELRREFQRPSSKPQ